MDDTNLEREVHADGGPVALGEEVVHAAPHQRRLARAGVAQDQDLEHLQLPPVQTVAPLPRVHLVAEEAGPHTHRHGLVTAATVQSCPMFTLAILSPSAASGSVVSVTGQSGHWALTRPLLLSTLRNCQPETGGGPLLENQSTSRVFTLSSLLNNSILVWWSPRLLLCGHGYS